MQSAAEINTTKMKFLTEVWMDDCKQLSYNCKY